MGNQHPSNLNAERVTAANADTSKGSRKRTTADRNDQNAKKSRKDQLIGFLSKPSGARVSVLVERFGWQPHTVRAALSGLRKQGFEIATSKSARTGEALYTITGHPASDQQQATEPAA